VLETSDLRLHLSGLLKLQVRVLPERGLHERNSAEQILQYLLLWNVFVVAVNALRHQLEEFGVEIRSQLAFIGGQSYAPCESLERLLRVGVLVIVRAERDVMHQVKHVLELTVHDDSERKILQLRKPFGLRDVRAVQASELYLLHVLVAL